jgi:oligopeptide transport system substrate-binding protein
VKSHLRLWLAPALLAALLGAGGCGRQEGGPVRVVAIGAAPTLANPNRDPLTPGSALLLEAVAQGLVRFDASGEIEPALAQSWIVSNDGLRYTFRLRRAIWTRGETVTAAQVVDVLNAVIAGPSRNPLKPVLGAVDQIEAMTDRVLEIRLKSPRPNFLQLLAQPEMALSATDQGTGPYRLGGDQEGALRLVPPPPEESEEAESPADAPPQILLRSAPAAEAVARFAGGEADLVTGGTIGDLPLLLAAEQPAQSVVFDPARGLLGLSFLRADGLLGDAGFRQALNMAIDREGLAQRFGRLGLQVRASLLPGGLTEVPQPNAPEWAGAPLAARRAYASNLVAERAHRDVPHLRVALPDGLGYRLLFALIRRDWRAIGVEAVAVPAGQAADLRLIDEVAPADLAPWYLRHFLCGASAVCDESASFMIEAARLAPTPVDRAALLAMGDRRLNATNAFIPIGSPLRWSLRTPRLNGFRPNVFARHALPELIDPGE